MSSSLKLTMVVIAVDEDVAFTVTGGGSRTIFGLNETSEFIGISSSCWMSVRRGYWKK